MEAESVVYFWLKAPKDFSKQKKISHVCFKYSVSIEMVAKLAARQRCLYGTKSLNS